MKGVEWGAMSDSLETQLAKAKEFSEFMRKEYWRMAAQVFSGYVPQNHGWFAGWPDDAGEYQWLSVWGCGCCIRKNGIVLIEKRDDADSGYDDVAYTNSRGEQMAAAFEPPIKPEIYDDGKVYVDAFRLWDAPPRILTHDSERPDDLHFVKADKVLRKT